MQKLTKKILSSSLRFFQILSVLLATAALILGIERLCHAATDGFALTKVTHLLPQDPEFTPPVLSTQELSSLRTLLSQPFHYLSCGGQTYVFLSEDGHYVIKLLKFHHRRIPTWIQNLPLPHALAHYRSIKAQKKEFRLKRTLRSYVLAYTLLKQETGMVYHHLHHTNNLDLSILLFDRLGYRYDLEADDYAFLIQKRGCSTQEMLSKLMSKNDIEGAQKQLSELIALSVRRCQKGIKDRDFKFKSNLGFIDGVASQIDLGSLSIDETYMNKEIYAHTIYEAAQRFLPWLQQHYPILVNHFDNELQHLIDHSL